MKTRSRIERLEKALPPLPTGHDSRYQRYEEIVARWDQLFDAAEPLMTDDDVDPVLVARFQLLAERAAPFATWL